MKTTGAVEHVTESSFETDVLDSDLPVLVDLFASWCGPCRMLSPVLEKLAEEYRGRVKIVKVDVDEEPGLAGRFGVTGVPTLLFFKDGRVVDQVVGFAPPAALAARLDALAHSTGRG